MPHAEKLDQHGARDAVLPKREFTFAAETTVSLLMTAENEIMTRTTGEAN